MKLPLLNVYYIKNSLTCDLQKPFGFLIVVISLVESEVMESKDFIRTENYYVRLKPTGTRKIVNEFSKMLKKVSYQKKEGPIILTI